MRFQHPRPARTARKTLTGLGAAGFLVSASLLTTTGTATASMEQQECTGSASGAVGESIELAADSVQDEVVESIEWAPELRIAGIKNDRTRMDEAFEDGKVEPIPLGEVPNEQTVEIDGAAVAGAVVDTIDDVEEINDITEDEGTRDDIIEGVSEPCGLVVTATDYEASNGDSAPAQRSAGHDQSALQQSPREQSPQQNGERPEPRSAEGGAGADSSVTDEDQLRAHAGDRMVEGTGDARAPRRDYSDVPAAEAGEMDLPMPPGELYESDEDNPAGPGVAPEFGILGGNESNESAGEGERPAGEAEALAANRNAQGVQLPMLLAVVALAGTTAGLLRTWVLRKV